MLGRFPSVVFIHFAKLEPLKIAPFDSKEEITISLDACSPCGWHNNFTRGQTLGMPSTIITSLTVLANHPLKRSFEVLLAHLFETIVTLLIVLS